MSDEKMLSPRVEAVVLQCELSDVRRIIAINNLREFALMIQEARDAEWIAAGGRIERGVPTAQR